MIIEEGSIISIIDKNDIKRAILDEIYVESDTKIEDNGKGYTFLLRSEGNEENSIFESEEIIKTGNNTYEVRGYFKDAFLVISRFGKNSKNAMHESYMDD